MTDRPESPSVAQSNTGNVSIMEAEDFFRHEPFLPSVEQYIRLIRWKRTSGTDLDFNIIHVALVQAPAYIAMSYMWGKGEASHPITIDGKRFLVRQTVEEMLRAVTKLHAVPGEDFYLWIDQICIDQSSVEDKNRQVALMGAIFKGAQYVVAWLSSSPELDRAAALLHDVVSRYALSEAREDMARCLYDRMKKSRTEHEAFLAFTRHEYWSRTWILQELTLAKRVDMLTKNYTFPWIAIEELLHIVLYGFEERPMALHFGFLLKRVQRPREESLVTIMGACSWSCCTDPRDKVFALRSLMKEQDRSRIIADYAMSVEDVFLNAANAMLENDDYQKVLRVTFLGQSMMPQFGDEFRELGQSSISCAFWGSDEKLRAMVMQRLCQIVGKEPGNVILTGFASTKA